MTLSYVGILIVSLKTKLESVGFWVVKLVSVFLLTPLLTNGFKWEMNPVMM